MGSTNMSVGLFPLGVRSERWVPAPLNPASPSTFLAQNPCHAHPRSPLGDPRPPPAVAERWTSLGRGVAWRGVAEEARRWTLLAQIDSDREADLRWGDVGTPYWLIHPEDLAARDFGAARFTWQCG